MNLSVPNFEKSSEWINSSQIDYPDILSDTDLQHETTFLNASVMNYFEGKLTSCILHSYMYLHNVNF